MLKPQISLLRNDDLKQVKQLVSCYKFNEYRNCPQFTKVAIDKYLLNQIIDTRSKNQLSYISVAKNRNNIVGLISLIESPWETKYFGFKMAEIRHFIVNGYYEEELTIKNELLSFILQICRNKGIAHISCKADVHDFSSIHCLELHHFMSMGTSLTYFFDLSKVLIPDAKGRCNVRMLAKRKDISALINLTKSSIIEGRFQIDPYIPREKAKNLYAKWIENCCRGLWADEVILATRDKEIVGFITYQLNRELKKVSGIGCLQRGLAVVSPRGLGCFIALLKEVTVRGRKVLKADLAEFETQAHNYPMIKVLQRLKIDIIRFRHSFHKWL